MGWTLPSHYLGNLLMLWEGGEESVIGCGVGKIPYLHGQFGRK